MKVKQIKTLLTSEIKKVANNVSEYCLNLGVDFTRKRKLPLEMRLSDIIGIGSKSLTNEFIDLFQAHNNMAHIQEKGWFFLRWVKDGKTGIKDGFEKLATAIPLVLDGG